MPHNVLSGTGFEEISSRGTSLERLGEQPRVGEFESNHREGKKEYQMGEAQ
jgi:hypothetical protein